MQKIIPHLWFDKEAKEAVNFYVSLFPNSKLTHTSVIHDVPTPTGNCDIISFELSGQPFMAINARSLFKFNPSVSFIINFDPSRDKKARQSLDAMWNKLSESGQALMPLDKYPFSERYGWTQDKYGVSWQVWPVQMGEIMKKGTRGQIDRPTQVFLPMKKFDLATLRKTYKG